MNYQNAEGLGGSGAGLAAASTFNQGLATQQFEERELFQPPYGTFAAWRDLGAWLALAGRECGGRNSRVKSGSLKHPASSARLTPWPVASRAALVLFLAVSIPRCLAVFLPIKTQRRLPPRLLARISGRHHPQFPIPRSEYRGTIKCLITIQLSPHRYSPHKRQHSRTLARRYRPLPISNGRRRLRNSLKFRRYSSSANLMRCKLHFSGVTSIIGGDPLQVGALYVCGRWWQP